MNWIKVIDSLRAEAARLRRDVPAAFPHDYEVQKEANLRAAIATMLADALTAGLNPE